MGLLVFTKFKLANRA